MVSAKVGIDDKVSLLLNGAADYITKPFDILGCPEAVLYIGRAFHGVIGRL